MKVVEWLKKYPVRDLLVYAVYVVRFKAQCRISTTVFKIKCLVNNIELNTGHKIWGRVVIRKFPGSRICIGDGFRQVSCPIRYTMNVFNQSKLVTMSPKASIKIGSSVGVNSINIVARSQQICIGNRVMVGGNCQIMDSDFHPLWPVSERWHYPGDQFDKGVVIEDDVFIGINVIILKGVTIGEGAVVGAGSVVSTDVPPFSIVRGNPAVILSSKNKSPNDKSGC